MGYSFAPVSQASIINLSADKDLGHRLQLNSSLSHDPVNNVSGLRLGLSKRLGRLGYSIAAADGGGRQVVVSAEPLSPYGMIAVSAAIPGPDGVFDQQLAGIGFLVNGSRARTIAGSRGGEVIAYLQPDLPVDVTLDPATVEDPFMVPVNEGCRVVPRAGVVATCNFTLTVGGEIDGIVMTRGEVPVKGVRVDLMAEGVDGPRLQASTRSEESGYYLFKTVKPGSHRIVIPDAEAARLKAAAVRPLRVAMPVGGDMVSGQDIFLEPAAPVSGTTLEAGAEIGK